LIELKELLLSTVVDVDVDAEWKNLKPSFLKV
jgi:hypothetical protein